jgi:alpha-L-fucosidase 2
MGESGGKAADTRVTRRDFFRTAGSAYALHAGGAAGVEAWAKGPATVELTVDPIEQARRNSWERTRLSPDFFEGMLLGNGDVGVVANLRPDALGLHIGKGNCWDRRVSEEHHRDVLPFDQLLELWAEAGEVAKREGDPGRIHLERAYPPLADYLRRTRSSYAKPWPRPWPCGTVWFHWDPRWVTLATQKLDISDGLMTALLEVREPGEPAKTATLCAFVSWDSPHIAVFTDIPVPIQSVAYYPHIDEDTWMPLPELAVRQGAAGVQFSCFQRLPAIPPREEAPVSPPSPDDGSLALTAVLPGEWQEVRSARGSTAELRRSVGFRGRRQSPFRFDLALSTSEDDPDTVRDAAEVARSTASVSVADVFRKSRAGWHAYWSKSAVRFEDRELETIWYFNHYLFACCVKEGKTAPGLFGNWSMGQIGTAWHGDYHMNYNTQQVYWGAFSSNRVDQHLPYVELVEELLPIAKQTARDHFGLPGAYFPHSAYPVPMKVNPYPVPPWAYQICETPWTVQSLWWHYLYTMDVDYLRRVYPLLRAATLFIVHYVKEGDDGNYHIAPTVSPENWGFTVDFRLNRDCIIDLALSEFLLDATVDASVILDVDEAERLVWRRVRANLAPYPKAEGPLGEVWLDVLDAPVEYVYSHPVTLGPVFPAEQVGLGRREDLLDIARRTTATARLEGATDLVVQPLTRARLGMLDLEWFKKEVAYCLVPNGAAGCRVRQIGGRYRDSTSFDFLMRMGVWVENMALPAVLNECLLQSYTGVLRLFPNAQGLGPARFHTLRAVGAFLVSAAWDGRHVVEVAIQSEKGTPVRLVNPWGDAPVDVRDTLDGSPVPVEIEGNVVHFETVAGGAYTIGRGGG